jgi:outer membrane protein OmpA-like peptidoglycan-associated protein
MNAGSWQKIVILSGVLLSTGWSAMAATPRAVASEKSPTTVDVYPLDIKFDTNKASLQAGTHNETEFQKLTQELKNYPYAKVEIEGYADETGPENWNKELSNRRAQSVRQHFVNKYGIAADRITAVGYGESKSLAGNATPEGRAENRRVIARVIRVQPQDTPATTNRL